MLDLSSEDREKWFAMSKADQELANNAVRHAMQCIDECEPLSLSRSECVRLCAEAVLYALTHEVSVR